MEVGVKAFGLLPLSLMAAIAFLQNGCVSPGPRCPVVVSPDFSGRYGWPPGSATEAARFGCELSEHSIPFTLNKAQTS